MSKRTSSSIAGGCIGGGLGGLLLAVLGGWLTFLFLEPKFVPLEEPITADAWLSFLPVNLVLLSLVLAAALVAGVAGVLFGSMLGVAAFARLHVTRDANDIEGERPSGELGWVNGAIYGLVAVGLYGAVGSLLWLILGDEKPAATAFTLWALLGVTSGVLLSKRARAGQVLGIVFVLPGLLLFPLGTIVGLLLLYALCCDQTRGFLSNNWGQLARL